MSTILTMRRTKMATVKFSGELRKPITDKAKEVFQKQIDVAKADYPKEWADIIYERGMAEYSEHMNKLPVDFFQRFDTIILTSAGDTLLPPSVKLHYTTPVALPYLWEAGGRIKGGSRWSINEVSLPNDPIWTDIIQQVEEYKARIDTLEFKRDTFVSNVKQVIEAYETLAPALKVWTPLWDLLPEHTKERHKEIKTREKKEVNIDVDLSSMTSAVVMHKLTR